MNILTKIVQKLSKSLISIWTWIKNHPKDTLYILSTIIVAIIVLYPRKKDPIFITKNNEDLIQKVKYYEDKNGKLVAQLEQKSISEDEAKKRVAELALLLKVKPKNIKDVDKYISKTEVKFVEKPVYVPIVLDNDSNKVKEGYYVVEKKDDYINVRAVAGPDTGSISISSVDTLTRVVTRKNKLFKPDEYDVLLTNASPYNKIESGYSFTIKERPVLFDVSLQAGYNPFTRKPYVGIGISKSIFKIKK